MNKYIDADRLKAEMEKRMHICDGVFERNSDTYYQGKAVAYQEISSFLNSLQQEQPSLPSNLDEASKKIVIQLHPCMEYSSILGDHLTMGELVELVKAGANWQKEQDESRRIANIQLANTDTPVDTEMEVAFNDIWRDAEVIVERDGTLDEKATELMKAVCHDFFESGKEWQKEWMGEQAEKDTIERVIDWVRKNAYIYTDTQNDEEGNLMTVFLEKAFIDDLKKAMEEEK